MDDIRGRIIGSEVPERAIAAYEEDAIDNGNDTAPEATCPGDLDVNGTVGTSDLLILLTAFGENCDLG